MSNENYVEIKETLERMLKIEFNSSIKDMKKTSFFIDGENYRLMIKNYDSDIDFIDLITVYFYVLTYETLIHFQIGYSFNEFEIIEFDLDIL